MVAKRTVEALFSSHGFMIFGVFLLSEGCAHSPMAIANMSTAELLKEEDRYLCVTYASTLTSATKERVKQELIRRKSIDAWEWPLIDSNVVALGMNKAAAECSWGCTFWNAAGDTCSVQSTWFRVANGKVVEGEGQYGVHLMAAPSGGGPR
jgi:hypothetical protein